MIVDPICCIKKELLTRFDFHRHHKLAKQKGCDHGRNHSPVRYLAGLLLQNAVHIGNLHRTLELVTSKMMRRLYMYYLLEGKISVAHKNATYRNALPESLIEIILSSLHVIRQSDDIHRVEFGSEIERREIMDSYRCRILIIHANKKI